MQSGRQTLASIEQAIAQLHGEESRLDAALRSVIADDERLRQERAGVFRELARVKLDEIAAGRLVRNLDAAERRAVQVLDDRRNRLIMLAERRDVALQEVARAETDRHAAGEAVEVALDAVQTRRVAAETEVQTSPAWQAAKSRNDAAAAVAGEAEAKAQQSETELGAKKKPYDSDPLFTYLWAAGFGTHRYAAGTIVRMIDRMVAEFVGFSETRVSYALLSEIPVRLREHATGRRTAADETRSQLADLERRAMVAAGIETEERTLAAARHRLAAAEATLEGRQLALKALDQERAAMLSGTGDPAYAEALETIAAGDSRDDIDTLYREARRTETQADEALVQRIVATDQALAKAEREKQELRQSAKSLAARRIDVETVRDRFRNSGYDHPHASFGNDTDIGRALAGILEGVVRSGALWDVIRGGFSTRTTRGRPDFGEPSFPFPFPMPGNGNGPRGGGWREPESRGGWSPPADSGGGGSNDDGFSTGGTF